LFRFAENTIEGMLTPTDFRLLQLRMMRAELGVVRTADKRREILKRTT
jgi:hypothetical protein